jgi:asparagine synthase (glutamine-hydrolysing)
LAHKLPRPGYGKALLREAAALLGAPAEVCAGGDKVGFASPVPRWLQKELAPWYHDVLDRARPLAPPGILGAVLDQGTQPATCYDRRQVQALMTALWLLHHHTAPNPSCLRWSHAS